MPWERLATAIVGLPVSGAGDIAVGKGAYTDIVDIVAPSSAPAGIGVLVTIKIKNTWTGYVHVSAIGVLDSEERFIDWLDYWIPPGVTHSFSGGFTMPNKDVTIHAYSYYKDIDGFWRFDDEDEKAVSLQAAWVKLATKTVAIAPITWQKLATQTVTISPIVWEKLASQMVTITPIPVEWVKLATKAVTITPTEIPPEYELVYQHEYPRGKTFVGKAEECTATLTIPLPEQLFPNSWVVEKIADSFEEKVREHDAEMLDLKIYEDATPLFHTNYIVVATSTKSPVPWAIIIPLVLAIILVIAFIYLVIEFKDIDWGEIPAPIPWAILALAGGVAVLGVGAVVALAMPRE